MSALKLKSVASTEAHAEGVLRCFLNVNLIGGHTALSALAKKHGVYTERLVPGQYVLFINRAQDKLKVYAHNNIIAYYRSERGRINLGLIQELPRAFLSTRSMSFDVALREALLKQLAKRGKEGVRAL